MQLSYRTLSAFVYVKVQECLALLRAAAPNFDCRLESLRIARRPLQFARAPELGLLAIPKSCPFDQKPQLITMDGRIESFLFPVESCAF
jgi:hypothetical protein